MKWTGWEKEQLEKQGKKRNLEKRKKSTTVSLNIATEKCQRSRSSMATIRMLSIPHRYVSWHWVPPTHWNRPLVAQYLINLLALLWLILRWWHGEPLNTGKLLRHTVLSLQESSFVNRHHRCPQHQTTEIHSFQRVILVPETLSKLPTLSSVPPHVPAAPSMFRAWQ